MPITLSHIQSGKRANSTCFHWGLHISQRDSSLFVFSSKSTLWFISPVNNAHLAPDIVTCTCAHTINHLPRWMAVWQQNQNQIPGILNQCFPPWIYTWTSREPGNMPSRSIPSGMGPEGLHFQQAPERADAAGLQTTPQVLRLKESNVRQIFFVSARFRVPHFSSNNLTSLILSFLIQRQYKYSSYPSLGYYQVSWEEAFKWI